MKSCPDYVLSRTFFDPETVGNGKTQNVVTCEPPVIKICTLTGTCIDVKRNSVLIILGMWYVCVQRDLKKKQQSNSARETRRQQKPFNQEK